MAEDMGRKRWGLIGASAIARDWVIGGLREAGQDIVAVMSRNRERAASFATENDIARSTTKLEDILGSSDIDCVYISTTNERHRDEVIAAAKAGKHVLCEKPLTLTVGDARTMVDACAKAGVVMATNHHMRGAALHRRMREMIAQGEIGDVTSARIHHAGYLPEHLQTWRLASEQQGGGIFLDLSVHDIDASRFLLNDEPIDVVAMESQTGMAQGKLSDTAMYVLRMAKGTLVQVHESFVERHAITRIEVFGSKGGLIATDALLQKPVGRLQLSRGGKLEDIAIVPVNLYAHTVRRFVDAIDGKGSPLASGEDGVRSLQGALAVQEAAQSGKRTAIPELVEGTS